MSTPFTRTADGLVAGVTYHYTPDGRIDWQRMVEPRFLFVPKEHLDKVCIEQGVTSDKIDVTKVCDKWLRIRVAGLNQVAQLRGIMSIEYPIVHVDEASVTATCVIEFVPSFETGDLPFSCSAIASANLHSVDRDFAPYLATYAENRSFSRCVKRALQINILSDVEIDKTGNGGDVVVPTETGLTIASPTGFDGEHLLEARCREKDLSFEKMRGHAATLVGVDWLVQPKDWIDFATIQRRDAFVILGKMDETDKARAKAKKA